MSDSVRQGNGIRSTLAWRFNAQHVKAEGAFILQPGTGRRTKL